MVLRELDASSAASGLRQSAREVIAYKIAKAIQADLAANT